MIKSNQQNNKSSTYIQDNDTLTTYSDRLDTNIELTKIDSINKQFILLTINIENYSELENKYGSDIISKIEREIEEYLKSLEKEFPRFEGLINSFPMRDGKTILLINVGNYTESEITNFIFILKLRVNQVISKKMIELLGQDLNFKVSQEKIVLSENLDNLNLLNSILKQKEQQANNELLSNLYKTNITKHIEKIIDNRLIKTLYQPIVELSSGKILGWEAFTYLPEDYYLINPGLLFEVADEVNKLQDLEFLCAEEALNNLGKILSYQKIFLNIHPKTILSKNNILDQILEVFQKKNLQPYNIVIEITNKHTLKDHYAISHKLMYYKKKGYFISVENIGSGISNLWNLANLRPHYIKIDQSLIKDINSDPFKRAIVESLLTLADKISSRVIATGIETSLELFTLINIGVHYGQGYLISKPANPKPDISSEIKFKLSQQKSKIKSSYFYTTPVQNIMDTPVSFPSGTPTHQVKKALEKMLPISGVVIVKDDIPIGLVMSYNLNKELGTHYGAALYHQRPIDLIMDTNPLIVDAMMPVERVAEEASKRHPSKAYDNIIVVRNGKLAGVLSVQKLLDFTSSAQIEIARGANPLTGLPGNVSIEKTLQKKLEENKPLSIIYSDLDNFKVYNDTYGFHKGDEIILLLSRIISWATRKHGNPDDFVGHIGGDDFIVITTPNKVERIALSIVRCFKRLVLKCYNDEDRKRGYIKAIGRDGIEREYPLISVSLAIVDCMGKVDLESISQRASEVKKFAKSIPGNVYVRDKNVPLGKIIS